MKTLASRFLLNLVVSLAAFELLRPIWTGWLHLDSSLLVILVVVTVSQFIPNR